jgi:hypothetical protein
MKFIKLAAMLFMAGALSAVEPAHTAESTQMETKISATIPNTSGYARLKDRMKKTGTYLLGQAPELISGAVLTGGITYAILKFDAIQGKWNTAMKFIDRLPGTRMQKAVLAAGTAAAAGVGYVINKHRAKIAQPAIEDVWYIVVQYNQGRKCLFHMHVSNENNQKILLAKIIAIYEITDENQTVTEFVVIGDEKRQLIKDKTATFGIEYKDEKSQKIEEFSISVDLSDSKIPCYFEGKEGYKISVFDKNEVLINEF